MGGTIKPEQTISDLRGDVRELKRALEDIVNARGQKSRKKAIDRAREILYPEPEENHNWFEDVTKWEKVGGSDIKQIWPKSWSWWRIPSKFKLNK